MECDLDPADLTDHNRQTCVDHADHTDPTEANMCKRSRSYRSHQGEHDLDPADYTDHTGKQKMIKISQIMHIPLRKT